MPVKRAEKTHDAACATPQLRAHDFQEVNTGYSPWRAAFEAERCLRCQDPVCVDGCPVKIPIPDFIHAIATGDMAGAASILRSANPLPAICGRVCPQESQCEHECSMGRRFNPVGIGHLERYVADWERTQPRHGAPPNITRAREDRRHRRRAVGAGVRRRAGAAAVIRSRSTRRCMRRAACCATASRSSGCPRRSSIGRSTCSRRWASRSSATSSSARRCRSTICSDELGYAAVFIGTGAGLPQFLGIPGENLNGVYSANEFLTRVNLMRGYEFPSSDTPVRVGKRVAVIGAGNTAMDAVRTSLRMGAEEAMIVYRRSDKEMSARVEEYHHAMEEGVTFHWLTNPLEVVDDGNGWAGGSAVPEDAARRARRVGPRAADPDSRIASSCCRWTTSSSRSARRPIRC